MAAAQTKIQTQFQNFVFAPVDQEQLLQIVVFVIMIVGSVAFFLWNIRPFLALFSQVGIVIS